MQHNRVRGAAQLGAEDGLQATVRLSCQALGLLRPVALAAEVLGGPSQSAGAGEALCCRCCTTSPNNWIRIHLC